MCLLKKPTYDDIIKAKEVYIQQFFGRYKGKLVLRNESPSVYVVPNDRQTSNYLSLQCW